MSGQHSIIGSTFSTAREIATLLSVYPKTVYEWVRSKPDFPHIRAGKHLRFDAKRVIQYFEEMTEASKDACQQNPLRLEIFHSKRRSLKTWKPGPASSLEGD